MEGLQNRLDSFAKQKRVKNPSKTNSYINAKWPHPSHFLATPETLAEAGFFYNPSFEDRDNVTCFVCAKQLSEWEEGDDPFDIHWEKCGAKCCWASVRCGLRDDMDLHGRFIFTDKARLPASKQMERVRFETFAAGDGWMHDRDKNHGATSRKMAHAGFVYTAQHPGDDLATCLYCNVSLSGWDAEDDPMEEHRKREKKSGHSCPFFSTTTITPSETSKPSSRSQPQPQSKALTKSHKEVFLPTKTHDGSDESDNNARSAPKKTRKSRSTSASRPSTAKTPRKQTRSQSQTRGLGDLLEDEEDGEEAPTRRSRRPTTVAASIAVATPGKSKSRSKSVSRAKAQEIEEEDEEEPQAIPPPKSRSKAKVVKDEEGEEEEVVELKKSTRGRPKGKGKAKLKVAEPEPEPEPEPEVGDHVQEEVEQEVEQPKPRPKAKPVARKPSRTKPKPPPAPSPVESEEEEVLPPVPVPVPAKKTAKTPPAQASSKPNGKTRDVEAEVDVATQEPDEMDVFVSASSSLAQPSLKDDKEEHVLATLHIPKRVGKPKDDGDVKKQAPAKAQPKVQEQEEVPRKPPSKGKGKGKVVERKESIMKVVEISTDEEGGDDDGDGMDVDAGSGVSRGKEKEKGWGGKENIPVQNKAKEIANVADASAVAVSSPNLSKPVVKGKKQALVAVAAEKELPRPPSPSPPPAPGPPEDDVEMAEVETELGSESIQPPDEQPDQLPQVPAEPFPQTPPRRGPASSQPLPNPQPEPHELAPPTHPALTLPALSKLPFTPLDNLTDAELEMTVEEWIRYQMGVEFDKFRRDGERELQRWVGRAGEVRAVIEAL